MTSYYRNEPFRQEPESIDSIIKGLDIYSNALAQWKDICEETIRKFWFVQCMCLLLSKCTTQLIDTHVGMRLQSKCWSGKNDLPQFSSSAWFPQSLMPLQCMSWGRHTVRLPQGKYPRGHDAFSSVILSAVNKVEKPKDVIINAKHLYLRHIESPQKSQ